jgi:coenzyme PQQ biosynthesis protein PqqD
MTLQLEQRPTLSRAARLRFDARTHSYVLLSPERGMVLNRSATGIVERCTGEFTVRQIANEMIAACANQGEASARAEERASEEANAERVTQDVLDFVEALKQRRLLFLQSSL